MQGTHNYRNLNEMLCNVVFGMRQVYRLRDALLVAAGALRVEAAAKEEVCRGVGRGHAARSTVNFACRACLTDSS